MSSTGNQPRLAVTGDAVWPRIRVVPGTAQGADEIGLTVQNPTPQLAGQPGVRTGEDVMVTGLGRGSIAAMAGIGTGTVILQVNRRTVTNVDGFTRAIQRAARERRLWLPVRKDGMQRFVSLRW